MSALRCLSLSAITVLGLSASAWGQTKPLAPGASVQAPAPAQPAAPVSAEPKSTTATYGDWTLRCETRAGENARRICEVVQTVQLKGQQAPVAQVALGRPAGSSELHVIAVLPVNISFPSTVRISLDEEDAHPAELAWRRCLPGGCFADAVADAETLARWRTAAASGRMQVKDAATREAVLPVSFRGLAQALDALGTQ